MNFSEKAKESQAANYVAAAEAIGQSLGTGWDVTVTKAGRAGRVTQKAALIEAKRGATCVEISTNERGRELKIVGAEKTYSETDLLAAAIKEHVGGEPDAGSGGEGGAGEEKAGEEEPAPTNPVLRHLDGMRGAGLPEDDESVPIERKNTMTYVIARAWGSLNRLVASRPDAAVRDRAAALQTALKDWMVGKIIPTSEQWAAFSAACESVVEAIRSAPPAK